MEFVTLTLYFPLVQSYIDFCITLGENVPLNILVASKKIQNRVACFLTQKYDYTLYQSGTLKMN